MTTKKPHTTYHVYQNGADEMNYQVKVPTRTKAILGGSLLFSAGMLQIAAMTERTFPVLFFMQMAVIGIVVMSLIAEAYATWVKRTVEIHPTSDTINLHGNVYHANEIESIKIKGVNSPAIGIQLKSKHIIPLKCCFSFTKGDQRGNEELLKWAERNGVPVKQTYFITWI